jgi:hypothetical protein
LLPSRSQGAVQDSKAGQSQKRSYASDQIETLGHNKLLTAVLALFGVLLFIFGAWLDSYGIDRLRGELAFGGWPIIVLGIGFVIVAFLACLPQWST